MVCTNVYFVCLLHLLDILLQDDIRAAVNGKCTELAVLWSALGRSQHVEKDTRVDSRAVCKRTRWEGPPSNRPIEVNLAGEGGLRFLSVNERCLPEPGSWRQAGTPLFWGAGSAGERPTANLKGAAIAAAPGPDEAPGPALAPRPLCRFQFSRGERPLPRWGLMERPALPRPSDECCHSGWKQARRGRSIKREQQIVFGVFYSDAVIDCWWGLMPTLAAHGESWRLCSSASADQEKQGFFWKESFSVFVYGGSSYSPMSFMQFFCRWGYRGWSAEKQKNVLHSNFKAIRICSHGSAALIWASRPSPLKWGM